MLWLGGRNVPIHPDPHALTNTLVLVGLADSTGGVSERLVEPPTMRLRYLFTPEGRLA